MRLNHNYGIIAKILSFIDFIAKIAGGTQTLKESNDVNL